MYLTTEDLKQKLNHINDIVSRINIYKYNLEMILCGPLIIKMPPKHFEQLVFDICRLLIIDISQLIKESKNENLNFYTIKKSLAMKPHKYNLDLSELDINKNKLDLLIEYRDKKYAHTDPGKELKNIKISEILPLINAINNVFEDIHNYLGSNINKNSYKTLEDSYDFYQYFYNALHSGDLKIFYK